MKKIIALLLVAIMFIFLISCNSDINSNKIETARKEIVGEWKDGDSEQLYTFNDDGTGTFYGRPMRWKFDSDLSSYIICEQTGGQVTSITNIQTDESGKQYISTVTGKFYRLQN